MKVFVLRLLFEGISIFLGYLIRSWEDNGVHTLSTSISPKVKVTVRLEFELAYHDVAI